MVKQHGQVRTHVGAGCGNTAGRFGHFKPGSFAKFSPEWKRSILIEWTVTNGHTLARLIRYDGFARIHPERIQYSPAEHLTERPPVDRFQQQPQQHIAD